MLKRFFTAAVMILCMLVTANAQELNSSASPKIVLLKAGTIVPMVSIQKATSRGSAPGVGVDFMTTSDVLADGVVVVPSGTIVKGQICDARSATILGIGGDLTVCVNAMYAVDGTYVPLTGASVSAYGDDNTALAIVCGLFTFFGFLISGEQAVLPSGTPVQGVVMSNTYITLQ